MSDQQREIMYVGMKDRKSDNVSKSGRVWSGLGAIEKVTALDAATLTQHPDIWTDVTGWPTEKRIAAVESVREKIRSQARALSTDVKLKDASIEQIEDELARRKNPSIQVKPSITRAPPVNKPEERIDDQTGELVERPENSQELVAAIVGAIMLMDPGKKELFDTKGNPTLAAVVQSLGFEISAAELKQGIKEFGELNKGV